MYTWLRKQKERIISPVLDWVQVEVTTFCNAACIYCPHTTAREGWQNFHFPLTLFHKLLPSLNHTNLVFLQGWGEPLLHPDIFEMVRLCKKWNKKVGFTTNGILLNKENIHTIVDLQLDILGISFAGATPATHNHIRQGTDFDTVVAALEYMRRIKVEKKVTKPAIHLAYIMLASNFDELRLFFPIAKKVGARQVVGSNLTLISNPQLSREPLFNHPQQLNEYHRALIKIKKEAADSKILFAYRGPGLDETSLVCPENVCRSCLVNVTGEVSPCVFTNPILSGSPGKAADKQMKVVFKRRSIPVETFSFGNINNAEFTRIWESGKYRKFRRLFNPEAELSAGEILAGMPPFCKTCYKRLVSS